MAKSASMTSFDRERKAAVKACASAVGISSVSSKEHESRKDTAQNEMLKVTRVWSNAPQEILSDQALFNQVVTDDFADVKKQARVAAGVEFNRLLELHKKDPKKHRKPVYPNVNEARKNGSKGVRQRRRELENFQELVVTDLEAAIDSVRERSDNDPKLPWTDKCKIWAKPKLQRCEASENQIVVGTDSEGCIHVLGEHYKKSYLVQTRQVDGKTQEYCEVSIGPNGAKEEVEVIIGLQVSGKLFKDSIELLERNRRLNTNRSKFVRECMDEETPEWCQIPEIAKQD